MELLDVLKAQLEVDMKADGDSYFSFAQWATNETVTAKRISVETKRNIMDLSTSIEEEKAQREQMSRDHSKATNEVAKSEQELKEAKGVRMKERQEYESQAVIFSESVDQLVRSLSVLAKKFEESSPRTSLLSIAAKLRNTLEKSGGLQLSAVERETLDQFVRTSVQPHSAKSQQVLAPDFLQVRQHEPDADDFGEYKSQSSSVVSTLQRVLDKTKESQGQANSEEDKDATAFQK